MINRRCQGHDLHSRTWFVLILVKNRVPGSQILNIQAFFGICIIGWTLRRCKDFPRFSTDQGRTDIFTFYLFLENIHSRFEIGLKFRRKGCVDILPIFGLHGNLI